MLFVTLCFIAMISSTTSNPISSIKCTRHLVESPEWNRLDINCKGLENHILTSPIIFYILHGSTQAHKQKEQPNGESTSPSKPTWMSVTIKSDGLLGIEDASFGFEPNLKILQLQDNKIAEITRYSLVGLPNLNTLDLHLNNIKSIQKFSFLALHKLKYLNLAFNQLENINYRTFAGLRMLEALDLGSNNIADFPDETFTALYSLQSLNMDYNLVTRLDGGKLAGMNNLETLSMQSNYLNSINGGTFGGKGKLKILNLRYNELRMVNVSTFQGLRSLTNLNLHGNLISSIEDSSFANMPLLQELDLSHNALTTLSRGMFIGLINLRLFSAKDNWMHAVTMSNNPDLEGKRQTLIEAIGIVCRKRGLHFSDLSGNGISVLLNRTSEVQVGFDYRDPHQHFCRF